MITFYVYHVPQYVWSDGRIGKIGCTKEPHIRFLAYKGLSVQILEEHEDGWLAGDREKELQKEYPLVSGSRCMLCHKPSFSIPYLKVLLLIVISG